MAIRRIAVLGAGNGGCAAAADLTMRGYEVRLYTRSHKTLEPISERGGIEIIEGGRQEFAAPSLLTTKIAEAVDGADLIVIAAPSVAHESFGGELAGLLNDDQILMLNPGHTGGSLHMANVLRKSGLKARLRLCETVTLTYICRLIGPARVEVYRRTAHLRCAAFPAGATEELVGEIVKVYPNVVAAKNVMETGLANINAVMHPAGMVGNAGWIEKTSGAFYFYREGISPAVANVIAAVDRERLQIVKRLGLPPLSFVEIFFEAGLTSEAARASGSVFRATQESAPNRTIKSPAKLDHRYLNEDVGYGLVPMAEIGKLCGVQTPVVDALITLASEMNGVPYREQGLTLAKMGLSGIKFEEFMEIVQAGF
ncbi:MAG: NAD/NADP octopine/nopaline dehydrogenase family protein [Deltaproteobacteria bacterium]|nr:NAD/NADP octopine/nopaline dehydrogenase family protein [Deltaproteobacteria bacterium]